MKKNNDRGDSRQISRPQSPRPQRQSDSSSTNDPFTGQKRRDSKSSAESRSSMSGSVTSKRGELERRFPIASRTVGKIERRTLRKESTGSSGHGVTEDPEEMDTSVSGLRGGYMEAADEVACESESETDSGMNEHGHGDEDEHFEGETSGGKTSEHEHEVDTPVIHEKVSYSHHPEQEHSDTEFLYTQDSDYIHSGHAGHEHSHDEHHSGSDSDS